MRVSLEGRPHLSCNDTLTLRESIKEAHLTFSMKTDFSKEH